MAPPIIGIFIPRKRSSPLPSSAFVPGAGLTVVVPGAGVGASVVAAMATPPVVATAATASAAVTLRRCDHADGRAGSRRDHSQAAAERLVRAGGVTGAAGVPGAVGPGSPDPGFGVGNPGSGVGGVGPRASIGSSWDTVVWLFVVVR